MLMCNFFVIIQVSMNYFNFLFKIEFRKPLISLALLISGYFFNLPLFYIVCTLFGLIVLSLDTLQKIKERKFSLDYIAILAMVTALSLQQYAAGSVIAIMILLSEALELYGSNQAEAALVKLVDRIPKTCEVKLNQGFVIKKIQEVNEGDVIIIKPGEVVPLDGYLVSGNGLLDESSLTGEPIPQNYQVDQFIKSGFLNVGNLIELKVEGDFSRSAYQKIVNLVKEAKKHPAQLVRLAEKYNYIFSIVTLAIATFAYLISYDFNRVLAVLVIATPCPLLIAAPVSFLGGMNKASKKNIIIKRPAILEMLSRVTHIFFDKTGTLTLGEPKLVSFDILDPSLMEDELLISIAAIERHSLHPLARAIIAAKNERKLSDIQADLVQEVIGQGISGIVNHARFTIRKSASENASGIQIDVLREDKLVAKLTFDDTLKSDTLNVLNKLKQKYKVGLITGDKENNAKRLFGDMEIAMYTHATPEDKYKVIKSTQEEGSCVLMVGDGLNDAPALALANVGMVFSGTENSASIEAAGVAILNHKVNSVLESLEIAIATTKIAKQSILVGIGLSIAGMIIAMFGFIPPIYGALLQELIDLTVILNALRSAR